jgi:16S rRNA (guanine527-N7)-methyltransferase
MVLKIVFPNLKVTLLDSLNKRINFLNKVIEELDLKNIETIHTRAEDYAKENRNKFDITTARAVAHLSTLLEYSIPMTKENGYFVALKGNIEQEKEEVENALKVLNSKIEDIIYFKLPDNQGIRSLIKIKKEKDNKKYPRKNSEIKKNRL